MMDSHAECEANYAALQDVAKSELAYSKRLERYLLGLWQGVRAEIVETTDIETKRRLIKLLKEYNEATNETL